MLNNIFPPKTRGVVVPNIIGVAVIATGKYLHAESGAPIIIFSEFIIVPLLMGITSAWFWKDLNLKSRLAALYSCYTVLLAILLSSFFLGEGIICLIIVAPFIFSFVFAGVALGRIMFNKNKTEINVSIIALLIVVFVIDSFSKHEYENIVTDTLVIHARPDQVWKNVVSFKKIKQQNTFWLFKIGMPSPMETTVEGNYEGAGRKCIFSNGYVFGEQITTWQRDNNLTFDIINQPKDPEIMQHIDIIRGQFLLKDNGNGTTTLVGNSWYKLYVFPAWYYDLWAQSITRNVHLRVMEHIKELSEK